MTWKSVQDGYRGCVSCSVMAAMFGLICGLCLWFLLKWLAS